MFPFREFGAKHFNKAKIGAWKPKHKKEMTKKTRSWWILSMRLEFYEANQIILMMSNLEICSYAHLLSLICSFLSPVFFEGAVVYDATNSKHFLFASKLNSGCQYWYKRFRDGVVGRSHTHKCPASNTYLSRMYCMKKKVERKIHVSKRLYCFHLDDQGIIDVHFVSHRKRKCLNSCAQFNLFMVKLIRT